MWHWGFLAWCWREQVSSGGMGGRVNLLQFDFMQSTETVLTGLVWLAVLVAFYYIRHQVDARGLSRKRLLQRGWLP